MSSFLSASEFTLAACFATFLATLLFSQKIKDFFSGVPSELRASLVTLETSVKTDVKSYQSALIAKIAPAKVAAAPVAPAPVVVVAPAAPAPPAA